MPKYRVLQIDESYYPQFMLTDTWEHYRSLRTIDLCTMYRDVVFSTLAKAEDYIKENPKLYKIHTIE